jgi:hypothetical protein
MERVVLLIVVGLLAWFLSVYWRLSRYLFRIGRAVLTGNLEGIPHRAEPSWYHGYFLILIGIVGLLTISGLYIAIFSFAVWVIFGIQLLPLFPFQN